MFWRCIKVLLAELGINYTWRVAVLQQPEKDKCNLVTFLVAPGHIYLSTSPFRIVYETSNAAADQSDPNKTRPWRWSRDVVAICRTILKIESQQACEIMPLNGFSLQLINYSWVYSTSSTSSVVMRLDGKNRINPWALCLPRRLKFCSLDCQWNLLVLAGQQSTISYCWAII